MHLFWYCHYPKLLWKNLFLFVIENIDKKNSLLWEYVLFGFVNSKKGEFTEKLIVGYIAYLKGSYYAFSLFEF